MKSVPLLIDIGAKVSILSERFYNENLSQYPLLTSDVKLQAYGLSQIKVLGAVTVPVKYKGNCTDKCLFYGTKGHKLMGVDLFNRLGFKFEDPQCTQIQVTDNED